MSRSRKKSNFHGITTSDSEKYNKQTYHRGVRKGVRNTLRGLSTTSVTLDDEYEDVQFEKEVNNAGWWFEKDGKVMFDENKTPEHKRK